MPSPFFRLGLYISRHPRRVLALWAAAILLGAWGANKFPDAALGTSTGDLYGSASKTVSDALRTQFSNPFLEPLVVAIDSPRYSIDRQPLADWERNAAAVLSRLPQVRQVAAYAVTRDPALRSASGHQTMLLVGLAANDVAGQERAVPRVRDALAPLRAQLQMLDPAARVAVTGEPAVNFDINAASAEGGDRAEKRALPLTLIILLFAFGTVVAAALPFLMGLATTTVSLGLAFLLAHLMPVSNLLGNVVTMIGLAVGIDYSLLMVKDFRERLGDSQPAHSPRESAQSRRAQIDTAVAATVLEAGSTISWSGCTVAIGLLGLLWSPILETRSVGIGGALVVLVSVLAALTLLPACLGLLGNRVERWPIAPAAMRRADRKTLWRRLATWTVQRPRLSLALSGGAVVVLALPVMWAQSGFTNEPWFLPRTLESRAGNEIIARLHGGNAALDLRVLLRTKDGQALLSKSHLPAIEAYLARLRGDPRIAAIDAPLATQAGPARALNLSHDGRAGLIVLTPADTLSVAQIQQLVRDVAAIVPAGHLQATVGGTPAYYNDFSATMWKSFPKVFGFVIGATLLLLFCAFRSYLLPIKAILANLLAIAAGYGAVVAIFQLGWLNGVVGLERPFTSIPLEVPLMIFCLSFGLSMDYELFLLFRIRREYLAGGDNDRATVLGLSAVAPVITGAGLIMAVVFGAFVGAPLPALKMIGVGLCVSVLIDSSLIRGFIVPAVMSIAGRWNWYPGGR